MRHPLPEVDRGAGLAPLVIGVGHRYRGDDAVGPIAADRLSRRGVPAIEHAGEATALMDAWHGRDLVVLIDAMRSAAAPGTIRRFDAGRCDLPTGFFACSSHRYGPAEAVALARQLGRLPRHLIVYGVEGADFGLGGRLSPAVESALETLVEYVVAALRPARGVA